MNILISTDGTKQGEAAVDALRLLKLTASDKVKLISVVDMAVPLSIDIYGGYLPDTTELEKVARENTTQFLETSVSKAKEIFGENGPAVLSEVLFGSPESRIVETAEQMPADLIIVGSHGYNRWERLLLGSVSDSVVHHSPCSVLVVRAPTAADDSK